MNAKKSSKEYTIINREKIKNNKKQYFQQRKENSNESHKECVENRNKTDNIFR